MTVVFTGLVGATDRRRQFQVCAETTDLLLNAHVALHRKNLVTLQTKHFRCPPFFAADLIEVLRFAGRPAPAWLRGTAHRRGIVAAVGVFAEIDLD